MVQMNTSILDRSMLRLEARRRMQHASNVYYEAIANAANEDIDIGKWYEWHESLNDIGRAALREALAQLPGEDIFEMFGALDGLLSEACGLTNDERDQRWLACSRGWLIDATTLTREANFDEAFDKVDRARDRLEHVLTRERNSARSTRMLDPLAAASITGALSLLAVVGIALMAGRRVLA